MLQTAIEIDDELEIFGPLCCEGDPSFAEADDECQLLCMQQLCNRALEAHLWWATEVAPGCWEGVDPWCGFDLEACLSGAVHEQVIDDPADDLDPVDYFLEVSCSAHSSSQRNVGGSWIWLQYPENDLSDDPPMCSSPTEMTHAPAAHAADFLASEGAGTNVALEWQFGESRGIESTDAVIANVGYSLVPCLGGTGSCIEFSALDLSVSNIESNGITLKKAHLNLQESPAAPIEVVNDSFTIPDRALRFMLSADVDGSAIALSGTNQGSAFGQLTAEGLSLSNLRFQYSDPLFSASAAIEVSTSNYASPPSSTIVVREAPVECDNPVVFSAITHDPDGGAVSHQWWLPTTSTLGSSDSFEAVLPKGQHAVLLMTTDASGRTTAEGLSYWRSCE